ncbi:hypothetical protein RR46_01484 [Papilio xuthus]|uniref:Uncharacterized protein n=1 Tax=Papilio xuthus TaxID=66420 RepID=A0A0N0PA15_PAPXU|nr:hypothetical protein RR46_01484 [Papilio xuthus]
MVKDTDFRSRGHPSRRESEFKKPAHAPQNGRVHHRQSYPYNKSESLSSTGAPAHRPPPLRISNGFQPPSSSIDSSQLPIESILKEMKSLPTPLSVIAATPRKELDNKFIFNPYTNKVQENPQLANNDLKTPVTKPERTILPFTNGLIKAFLIEKVLHWTSAAAARRLLATMDS